MIWKRRPCIPEEVWQACKFFTQAVLSLEPFIKKVILFGSYSKGQQRPDSDIDIAIFVDAPRYFYRTRILHPRLNREHEIFGVQLEESDAVGKLRTDIQNTSFPLKEMFSVHIITPSNSGPFVDEVEKGIVLYRSLIYSIFCFLTSCRYV
ncbi:MAG: hypothetical protein A2719_03990 [Candidatus Ryanbacteria bacterium RIFCSPHIGHO2_01_FULL_45_22]|uniref:Polymerase nucleotidyl transferase domain-containing protein n=1 Tax=Candidatus Ryanbacteria bacterium RIFCSPHIGHO2_01_FULL_45_22 TaxID=1802114 RepID=A0A1G2G2Q3_9BACT|nr:MAG: hypothetical protein A2719_03990 [Candidatus Ryanbacteria bacterium RIFCSPHIGHO2_01_FULL_45_22]